MAIFVLFVPLNIICKISQVLSAYKPIKYMYFLHTLAPSHSIIDTHSLMSQSFKKLASLREETYHQAVLSKHIYVGLTRGVGVTLLE